MIENFLILQLYGENHPICNTNRVSELSRIIITTRLRIRSSTSSYVQPGLLLANIEPINNTRMASVMEAHTFNGAANNERSDSNGNNSDTRTSTRNNNNAGIPTPITAKAAMIPSGSANDDPNNSGNNNNNNEKNDDNKDDIVSIEIIDKTVTNNDKNHKEKENSAFVETELQRNSKHLIKRV